MIGISVLPGGTPTAQKREETPESLTDEIQGDLDRAQQHRDQLLAVSGPRTVENTLTLMNEIGIDLDAASSKAGLMENVHPDPKVRERAEALSQKTAAFATDLSLNRAVYDALAAVDVKNADALARRYHEKLLRDYRRSGVDKDEATREKIKALRDELVLIGQDFGRNIREGTRSVMVNPQDLEGMPEDYIAAHAPDSTGQVKITTDYPDYIPFMTYAKSGEARRRLYMEYNSRAFPQNREVLGRLIAKRYELARLLGYSNWAAYITEDKMARTPDQVTEFIQKLEGAARERADKDVQMLLARKRKDDPQATGIFEYEKAYYSELVKTEQYDFDSQELRAYFDYPLVKQGMLELTSRLFSVTFKQIADAPVWDPSVDGYEMYEGEKLIGRFYLDMHPREGKFKHAAQFTLRTGVKGRQIPEGVLVCNLPGGNGNGPALLEHDDVETFLHEFGHLLHHLFGGQQEWIYFSGVATEWDFVEAPSQMLEEWAIDAPTLQTFAKHHQTGAPLPTGLVEKLRRARDFGNGIYITQQNFYTALSLQAYNQDPSRVDFDKLLPELQAKYGSFRYVPDSHMYAAFGHLENYSAMYYTYMWSLVIAKDLAGQFDPNDMLNGETATRYRRLVLDPGGTKDVARLIEDFLGRPYGFESFRKWLLRGVS